MKTCLRVLEDDGVIGIFPEGSRGAGELELFKGGAAYLALVSGAPVVPVSLFGTREPGQDSHSRPARGAPPVEIVFGEPWRVEAAGLAADQAGRASRPAPRCAPTCSRRSPTPSS